jgi:hypothetical protein
MITQKSPIASPMDIKGVANNPILSFGIDGLHLRLSFSQFHKSHDLDERLEFAKCGLPVSVTIGTFLFNMLPFGKRPYRYVLSHPEIADIKIWGQDCFLTDAARATGQVFIEFRSAFLLYQGFEGIRRLIAAISEFFGADPSKQLVSRIDLYADMASSWLPSDVQNLVLRAKNRRDSYEENPENDSQSYCLSSSGKSFCGINIGSSAGSIFACIYNKSREIIKKDKLYWRDIWLNNGWDEKSEIWRVEFRLRSESYLELLGGKDFALFDWDKLWSYCSSQWLYESQNPNSSHSDRRKIPTNRWLELQKLSLSNPPKRIPAKREINCYALYRQAFGCLLSAGARLSLSHSYADMLNYLFDKLVEFMAELSPEKLIARGLKLGLDSFKDLFQYEIPQEIEIKPDRIDEWIEAIKAKNLKSSFVPLSAPSLRYASPYL